MAEPRFAMFARLLTDQLEQTGLPEEDMAKLRPVGLRLGLAGEAAWAQKKLTDDAVALAKSNDSHLGWKPYYFDVFQQEP